MRAAWAGAVVTKKDIRGKTFSSAASMASQSWPVLPPAEFGLKMTKAVMPPPFLPAGVRTLALRTARRSWAACPHRSSRLAIGQKSIGGKSFSNCSVEFVQAGDFVSLFVFVPAQLRGHLACDLLQHFASGAAKLAKTGAPHHHILQRERHFFRQRKSDLGWCVTALIQRHQIDEARAFKRHG